MNDACPAPGLADILAAAAHIAPHARVTPVLQSGSLDALAGCVLLFKAEPLQRAGSFKFRGACNAVWSLELESAARGVVTHSSGNHGAALALAARTRGIACHVVVPEGAVAAKLVAIEAAGGILHRCAPTIAAREQACARVQRETGAELVHPYADARVIAGQGTATLELLQQAGEPLDAIVLPVGGGGLASGACIAVAALSPATRVFLAEPAGAAETAESLARGAHVTDFVPDTICDGLRGTLGAPNFEILRLFRRGIVFLLPVLDLFVVVSLVVLVVLLGPQWRGLDQDEHGEQEGQDGLFHSRSVKGLPDLGEYRHNISGKLRIEGGVPFS